MPGYLGVLREAGVLERPLDSAADVWLISRLCSMPTTRAWADHYFPDGKQKMHGEHTPSGQKTQEKGRQIELNFHSGFMRLGNPENIFKTNWLADFGFLGTTRGSEYPQLINAQAEVQDERELPLVKAEALQKSTHNLSSLSRILSLAKNFYFWR